MKEEEINKRIAELCGWTECRLVTKVVLSLLRDPVAYGIPPNGTYEIACLNYCTDLNAMHEAEKVLTDEQCLFIRLHMRERLENHPASRYVWNATARQRAEAFLRTLGLWEEALK
jgi:hypothetical protein